MEPSVILWKRLDGPGHDACRLLPRPGGWRLEGTAVYRETGDVARLNYWVDCDAQWITREGEAAGWLGATPLLLRVERTAGGWTVNGAPVPDLGDCVDLDFGFTPATNTLQIRRTVLSEGESADVAAAWLNVRAGRLERLNQRYKRLGQTSYWYTAPRFDYTAVLEVNELGLVVLYPNLWEAQT